MIRSLRQTALTLMLLTAVLDHAVFTQSPITLTGTVTDQSGGVLAGPPLGPPMAIGW